MSGSQNGHKEPEPLLVEDANTGDQFLMYPLKVACWPNGVAFVYQCPTCSGQFPPAQWMGGCPGCSGRKGKKKRRKGC